MSGCIECGKLLSYVDGDDEEQPYCKKHMPSTEEIRKVIRKGFKGGRK